MYDDYSNGGKGTRPSFIDGLKAIRNTNKPPKDRVELLAFRREHGLDLWTGKPLRPVDTEVIELPDDEMDMGPDNPIMNTMSDIALL